MDMTKPICVIEDNKPIRKLYCTLIKKAGFITEEFADGTSALEWLKTNVPLTVIVDILLPDMNGTEILLLIKQNPISINVPVIASTGFASPGDKEKYLALGFDAFIPKPVNTATFVDEIKQVFSN